MLYKTKLLIFSKIFIINIHKRFSFLSVNVLLQMCDVSSMKSLCTGSYEAACFDKVGSLE